MLYSLNDLSYIHYIPHKKDYDRWRAGLSSDEYDAIMEELANRIEGKEVATSSWIPGADWTGTVFQPIYEEACHRDRGTARLFFGLLVWEAFMNHEEVWSFGRYEKNGVPIEGMTYFILANPPPA